MEKFIVFHLTFLSERRFLGRMKKMQNVGCELTETLDHTVKASINVQVKKNPFCAYRHFFSSIFGKSNLKNTAFHRQLIFTS